MSEKENTLPAGVWDSWEEDVKLFLLEMKAREALRNMGPEREEEIWQELFVDMANDYGWPEPKFTND